MIVQILSQKSGIDDVHKSLEEIMNHVVIHLVDGENKTIIKSQISFIKQGEAFGVKLV